MHLFQRIPVIVTEQYQMPGAVVVQFCLQDTYKLCYAFPDLFVRPYTIERCICLQDMYVGIHRLDGPFPAVYSLQAGLLPVACEALDISSQRLVVHFVFKCPENGDCGIEAFLIACRPEML